MKRSDVALGLLLPLSAAAQSTPPPASPQAPGGIIKHDPPKNLPPAEYRNDSLHIVYRYPAELQPQTATGFREAMERGHREHFKTNPADDAEHQQAEKCLHVLLYAKTPETTSGSFAVYADGDKQRTEISLPSTGVIIFAEFDRSCVPPGAKDDDILGSLASLPGQLTGFRPVDQQMWYDVDAHKTHFLSAIGAFEEEPREQMALAVASMAIDKHLVFWLFESDDRVFFNRLLNGTVQFGRNVPASVMPLTIGDGPPVKLVP